MTYEEHARDPRFEVILCGFYNPVTQRKWFAIGRGDIAAELAKLDLPKKLVIAHNAYFDASILWEQFGIEAGEYACTKHMAKPHVGLSRASLDAITTDYDLGKKGKEVLDADGKHLADFSEEEIMAYGSYCVNDCELSWKVYKLFRKAWHDGSMEVMSDTIRCSTVPRLAVNTKLLEDYLPVVEAKKAEAVAYMANVLGEDPEKMLDILRSNDQFSALLERNGIKVPRKPNKNGELIPAFAKTDKGMIELLNHENKVIANLCKTRIMVKSSINESRSATFLAVGYRGLMPMPLEAYGAATSRWVALGGQKLNVQNLPARGEGKILRQALHAANEDEVVVVCDLAQIEARRMAAHAGQFDLVEQFKDPKRDVYKEFAAGLYRKPVSEIVDAERQVGKVCILSLQFASNAKQLFHTLNNLYKIKADIDFCVAAVNEYRNRYKAINNFWQECKKAVQVMHRGGYYRFGANKDYIAELGKITLPDGYILKYENIQPDTKPGAFAGSLTYLDRSDRKERKLYYGIVANNVTQGSAARIIQWHICQLRKYGIRIVGTVHDELIFVVKRANLLESCKAIESTMKAAPEWASDTPIDCELTVGKNYGQQYLLDDFLRKEAAGELLN